MVHFHFICPRMSLLRWYAKKRDEYLSSNLILNLYSDNAIMKNANVKYTIVKNAIVKTSLQKYPCLKYQKCISTSKIITKRHQLWQNHAYV